MKHSIKILAMVAAIAGLAFYSSCSDDDGGGGGGALTLKTLTAGDVDLNGAASATGVPVDEPIVATFSNNIDESTVSAITLQRNFDDADVALDIDVDGKTVTITPEEDLSGGAEYILSISGALEAENGNAITALTRSFTTGGSFTPDDVFAHWSFEDNSNDEVGAFDPAGADVVDITYSASRNAAAGKAATFNGTTSIIEIPNGDQLIGSEFSLSFWMWLDSAALTTGGGQKGHFVMGVSNFNGFQYEINDREEWMKFATQYRRTYGTAPVITDTVGTDFFFNANGETHGATGREISTTVDKSYGKQGIRELIGKKWVNVVYTFSGSTKVISLYLNGELVHQQDYKLFIGSGDVGVEPFGGVSTLAVKTTKALPGSGDFYDKKWAFGFWQSRASDFASGWGGCCHYQSADAGHFKGMLDDVRIFHRVISEDEIELMYNSEKP